LIIYGTLDIVGEIIGPISQQFCFLRNLRDPLYVFNYPEMSEFYTDVANGDLPTYTFLEPRWFAFLDWEAQDEHPPHDVQLGEYLIADIYNAIRNSPIWNSTLFIITYDEHGGFFDHVSPPQHNVPAPDDQKPPPNNDPFNFTRLGVRVPMIMISPWIPRGTVVHEPPQNHYEHSSLAATMKKIHNLPNFLTKRDAWAATFEDVVMQKKEARTDCLPQVVPKERVKGSWEKFKKQQRMGTTVDSILDSMSSGRVANDKLSGLQRDIIAMAAGLLPESKHKNLEEMQYEQEGAIFVQRAVRQWKENILKSQKQKL